MRLLGFDAKVEKRRKRILKNEGSTLSPEKMVAMGLKAGLTYTEINSIQYNYLVRIIKEYYQLENQKTEKAKPVSAEKLDSKLVADVKVSDIDLSAW